MVSAGTAIAAVRVSLQKRPSIVNSSSTSKSSENRKSTQPSSSTRTCSRAMKT
jgi:hypothetical protein